MIYQVKGVEPAPIYKGRTFVSASSAELACKQANAKGAEQASERPAYVKEVIEDKLGRDRYSFHEATAYDASHNIILDDKGQPLRLTQTTSGGAFSDVMERLHKRLHRHGYLACSYDGVIFQELTSV